MKTKDKKDLHTKTARELKKLLEDAIKAVSSLKLDHQQNKLKNTRDIFNKRTEVAVLRSVMQVKKAAEGVAEKAEKIVEKKVKEVKNS